jgi:type IV pilus assembly protein PilB
VDLRVATLPTQHGERATLRLLALDMESLTLPNLGFSGADLATFEAAIARSHGLILVCGPTGSGKTTTLYAALRRILELGPVNAIAVQDPIEYDLPGVAQVEVDSAQKVTFESALRSILRHDPDVIQIGEIRDLETASIAIQAALTGHLVLATLHTSSAASALTRLVDMGVERYLAAATLRLVVAQRLVRRLCPFCREPGRISAAEAQSLRRPLCRDTTCFVPAGCVYCAGRGHAGRIGLFDVLSIDEEMEREIAAGADEGRVEAAARMRGKADMLDDALQKIARGETSVREVLAAVVA